MRIEITVTNNWKVNPSSLPIIKVWKNNKYDQFIKNKGAKIYKCFLIRKFTYSKGRTFWILMLAAEVNEETKEEAEEDTCFDLDLTWFSVIFCCYLFRRITIKTMAKKNYNANNKNNNEHVLKNTTTTIAKRLFNFFDRERICCLDTNERTDG